MKGIKCCGECAYYSMKKHKCMGGAKDAGNATDSYYADCPLDDAEPVRHGWWERIGGDEPENQGVCCSECDYTTAFRTRFCPMCGAKMSGGADNG